MIPNALALAIIFIFTPIALWLLVDDDRGGDNE